MPKIEPHELPNYIDKEVLVISKETGLQKRVIPKEATEDRKHIRVKHNHSEEYLPMEVNDKYDYFG